MQQCERADRQSQNHHMPLTAPAAPLLLYATVPRAATGGWNAQRRVIAGKEPAARNTRASFRSMDMSNNEATAVISPSPREAGRGERRSQPSPPVIPAERQREPESITTDDAKEFWHTGIMDFGFAFAPFGMTAQKSFSRRVGVRGLLTTTTTTKKSLKRLLSRMIPEKWRPVFGPGSCAQKKGKRSAERRIVQPMSAQSAARCSHCGRNAAFRRSRLRHSPPAITPMAQLQNRVSRGVG